MTLRYAALDPDLPPAPRGPHVWEPCLGIKPRDAPLRYFCRGCHRKGTAVDIYRSFPKWCERTDPAWPEKVVRS